ncbi:MAG TPA: replication-relaxation family protein [Candidatus Obscuribacter sp.]|nr:replication-relaxation family protein [Candidatus Obscuribacter sp.]MBK9278694.1 replication-relaxation family protein [Candidatus Obscuribacter sp.]HND68511.1 replication-relaxation family protein [Candidatus Obscuribacter sp.]
MPLNQNDMVGKALKLKSKKRSVVLMDRDIAALQELYLHRTISSSQLARLCFPEISYETARKRLRRIQQAGFTGCASSGRMEGRGRPELIYFLTAAGARALEQHRGISWETIPTGPPHTYHKEHFLRLVDLRLALEDAEARGLIGNLEFVTGREFWKELAGDLTEAEEQADATIGFTYADSNLPAVRVLLEIDTGNFRQTRHWEPKIRAFLKTGLPIWVITGSAPRIFTLRKWTQPLLEEAGAGAGKCVFAVYNEIVENGVFGAQWQRTDGSFTDLRPRL